MAVRREFFDGPYAKQVTALSRDKPSKSLALPLRLKISMEPGTTEYLLMIYTEELDDQEMATLSGICDDCRIDKLDEISGDNIAEAYTRDFGFVEIGFCYRVFHDSMPPPIHLMKKNPIYVGKFDLGLEQECLDLADFARAWFNMRECTEGLGEMAQSCAELFKEKIGVDCALKWKSAKMVEDTVASDFSRVEQALTSFFQKHRLFSREVPPLS